MVRFRTSRSAIALIAYITLSTLLHSATARDVDELVDVDDTFSGSGSGSGETIHSSNSTTTVVTRALISTSKPQTTEKQSTVAGSTQSKVPMTTSSSHATSDLPLSTTTPISSAESPSDMEARTPTASPTVAPVCLYPVQYEDQPPTSSTDRRCRFVTECGAAFGTYVVTDATPTSNAVCNPIKGCSDNEYEVTAPGDYSDRVCGPYTKCNYTMQYDRQLATASTDRTCAQRTTSPCDATLSLDLVQVMPATVSSDRVCARKDDCETNPCENEGICVDGVHAYTCDCNETNYLGVTCSYFDACLVNPCAAGSACFATAEGAMCICPPNAAVDACCQPLVNGATLTSSVCMDGATAESTFNAQTDASTGSGGKPSSIIAIACIALVASCFMIIFIVVARRKRRERLRKERASNMEDGDTANGFNPIFGTNKQRTAQGTLGGNYRGVSLGGNDDYAVPPTDVSYTTPTERAWSPRDNGAYAVGADGGQPTYTAASPRPVTAIYDKGTADGIYGTGAADAGGDTVYDTGDDGVGVVHVQSDAVYDDGAAAEHPCATLRRRNDTDPDQRVYDTGAAAEEMDSTYGLNSPAKDTSEYFVISQGSDGEDDDEGDNITTTNDDVYDNDNTYGTATALEEVSEPRPHLKLQSCNDGTDTPSALESQQDSEDC